MCDSLSRSVAEHSRANGHDKLLRLVNDGTADPLAMHRPGARHLSDVAAHDAQVHLRDAAYRDAAEADAIAWMRDDNGEFNRPGAQVGMACTIRSGAGRFGAEGSPGHLKMVDGKLVCVADGRGEDSRSGQASRDGAIVDARMAAYDEANWEAENAWRGQDWFKPNRPAHFGSGERR
jgi:hypothetical protein